MISDPRTQRLWGLVNDARLAAGCATLERHAQLDMAALEHARDMAARSFFGHGKPEGSSPQERIEAAGYRWARSGENIAAGYDTAEPVLAAWWASDGHRANLLEPAFVHTGIGVANAGFGVVWVQLYAAPRTW